MSADLLLPGPRAMDHADAVAHGLGIADAESLLTDRAALMGLRSNGRISAGGSCRVIETANGWAGVNLPRPSDVELVGAVIGRSLNGQDPWEALGRHAETVRTGDLVERCQLLGVPASIVGDPAVRGSDAVEVHGIGEAYGAQREPLVLDLSSMWAGPLCTRILGRNGMRVLKVESTGRPDGARFGNREFFEWLLDGHDELSLDFDSLQGRESLKELVSGADVVVEASRPRALRSLGLDAEAIVRARPGMVWLSITGYGRTGPRDNWTAFGDDAAAAGGLVETKPTGPEFIADAVADPLTGLTAADAVLQAHSRGGGVMVEVRMAAVARKYADLDAP